MLAPTLPDNAPFSPEQRSWLNGFMAGMQNISLLQNGWQGGSSAGVTSMGMPGMAGATVAAKPRFWCFMARKAATPKVWPINSRIK
jgi:hypothetical protein